MPKRGITSPSNTKPNGRPALSPEARNNQLIALAYDLVEERLRNGSASSQETTHFLKMGNTKAKLELEVLERQRDLLSAKTESIKAEKKREELYAEAIKAMRKYNGYGDTNDSDEEEQY